MFRGTGRNDVDDLLKSLWEIPRHPCSLYVRGSVVRQNEAYQPWDIDLCLVVHSKDEFLSDVDSLLEMGRATDEALSKRLMAKHPTVPPLDLKCTTRSHLLYSDESLIRRILLLQDGVLICGEDVLSQISLPAFDLETADKISNIMRKVIASQIEILEKALIYGMESDRDWSFECKTLAKAVLRSAAVPIMRTEGKFIRNPSICYVWIQGNVPEESEPARMMMACVEGAEVVPESFIFAAKQLEHALTNKGGR